jgi:hypothetical protein
LRLFIGQIAETQPMGFEDVPTTLSKGKSSQRVTSFFLDFSKALKIFSKGTLQLQLLFKQKSNRAAAALLNWGLCCDYTIRDSRAEAFS